MLTIEPSSRLRYELMTADAHNAELMFELDQDPEVMRYINGGKCTTREEISKVYIPRMQAYTNPDKGWGLWKVIRLEDEAFLGFVLVRPMHFFDAEDRSLMEQDNLELGWRYHKQYWGKGYGTEAARAVADALIQQGGLNYLTAIADEENSGSIGIMKKLGMRYLKKDLHKDPLGDVEVVYYQCKVV